MFIEYVESRVSRDNTDKFGISFSMLHNKCRQWAEQLNITGFTSVNG